MNHMKERYQNEVVPALMKALNLDNVMDVPRIQKVVVNIGMGEAMDNPKALEAATTDISAITGQRPVMALKSVMVTLRGEKMWSFLDRLMNIVLPRVRDFRGISPNAFDGRGNYTLGLREQIIFPEIEYDKVDKVRGMEITIVTTARTDDRAAMLLQLLGMPFRKD